MKALSVQQPYASLIAHGEKTVEIRSWRTQYRGDLLIVASPEARVMQISKSSCRQAALLALSHFRTSAGQTP